MVEGGRVALLPNNGGRISPEQIRSYVSEGAKIYSKIQSGYYDRCQPGQNPPAIGEDEIASVMWYLQSLASLKAGLQAGQNNGLGADFKEGGLLIEDGQGRLKHFLSLANSYERSSEHFERYQTEPRFCAHGVDVGNVIMPHNRRSVLHQNLPDDVPTKGARLLYVKMEPFSCRGLSTKITGYSVQADPTGYRSMNNFFGNFRRFFHNLGETFQRFFSRDLSNQAVKTGVDNLERAPKNFVKNYNQFANSLKTEFSDKPQFNKIIEALGRIKINSSVGGVHLALKAIETAERQAIALADSTGKDEFLARLDEFKNIELTKLGDHPELRFGREVILTANEFGPIDPQPVSTAEFEGTVRRDRTLNESEVQSVEESANLMFAAKGEVRDELNRIANNDLARSGRVRLLDSPNAQGESPVTVYDTLSDSTPRGRHRLPDPKAQLPEGFLFLPDKIDRALTSFGGSQQFTDTIRTVMSQAFFSELSSLVDYDLGTQLGIGFGEVNFSVEQDFTLTRLTPRTNSEGSEPRIVEYEFEVAGHGHQRINGRNGLGDEIQGSVEPKLTFRLTHDTESGEVKARLVDGRVNYEITRTVISLAV
jgi:hypothetical protein